MAEKETSGCVGELKSLSRALPSARRMPTLKSVKPADGMPAALPPCFAEVWRRRSSTLPVHRNERAALEAVASTVPLQDTGDPQEAAGVYLAALVVALRRVVETAPSAAGTDHANIVEGAGVQQQQLSKRQRQKARKRIEKKTVLDVDEMHSAVNAGQASAIPDASDSMNEMDGSEQAGDGLISSLVYLISLALRDAKSSIVVLKCDDILSVLDAVARLGLSASACRHAAAAISGTLALLDARSWKKPIVQRSYLRVLSMCADNDPKTRRRARDALQSLLEGPNGEMISLRTSGAAAAYIMSSLREFQMSLGESIDSAQLDARSGPTKLIFLVTSISVLVPALQPADATSIAKELVVLASAQVPHVATFVYIALSDLFDCAIPKTAEAAVEEGVTHRNSCHKSAIPTAQLGRMLISISDMSLRTPCAEEELVAFSQCVSRGALGYFDAHKFSPPRADVLAKPVACLVECLDPAVAGAGAARRVTQALVDLVSHRWSRGRPEVFLALQPLFGYRFKAIWSTSVLPLRTFLESGGIAGPASQVDDLLAKFIEKVVEIRDQARQAKDRETLTTSTAILTAVLRGGGVAIVLRVVRLEKEETVLLSNAWILPLLEQHVRSADMLIFTRSLRPLAMDLSELSVSASQDERAVEAKNARMLATQVWGLMPGFCQSPTDISQEPSLTEVFEALTHCLAPGMDDQVRQSALRALRNLSVSVAGLERDSAVNEAARKHFARLLKKLFPLLSSAVQETVSERRSLALEAITKACAACDDAKLVTAMLRKAIRRLLEASVNQGPLTDDAGSGVGSGNNMIEQSGNDCGTLQRHAAADISIAIAESGAVPANSAEIEFLERTMTPLFVDPSDAALQKKAYRTTTLLVSAGVVGKSLDSAVEFVKNTATAAAAVSSSSKATRLGLIQALVAMSTSRAELGTPFLHACTESFLPEVTLGTRDVSEKTRVASFHALSAFARAWFVSERDGAAGLIGFLSRLSAGLAGRNASMLAATLTSLSHFIYEFRGESSIFPKFATGVDALYCIALGAVKDTPQEKAVDSDMQDQDKDVACGESTVEPGPVAILLRHSSREVQKAALGSVKVATVALSSPAGRLHAVLPGIIPGLVAVAARSKKKDARLRVRVVLERLLRKCGRDSLEAVFPAEHMKLLNAVRKQHSRDLAKKHEAKDARRHISCDRVGRLNHHKGEEPADSETIDDDDADIIALDSDESDADIEKEVLDGDILARSKRIARKSDDRELLIRENSRDVVDLLETHVADGFATRQEIAETTKQALTEQRKRKNAKSSGHSEFMFSSDGRPIFEESASDQDSAAGDAGVEDSGGGQAKADACNRKRKRSADDSGGRGKRIKGVFGEEYRGKRGAAGDMKKPGVPDPYAYVPLGPSITGSASRALISHGRARKGRKTRMHTRQSMRVVGGTRGIPARR